MKVDIPGYVKFLFGGFYIPHEGSKYHNREVFEIILSDLMNINHTFSMPLCFVGDFNSRIGSLNDLCITDPSNGNINNNVFLNNGPGDLNNCESFSIPPRNSCDAVINNNGRSLIEFCKSLDISICNGRFGQDTLGNFTFNDTSVIDYIICSKGLMKSITDMKVDTFDSCLSDKHCPVGIDFAFKGNIDSNIVNPTSVPNASSSAHNSKKVHWIDSKYEEFQSYFSDSVLNPLILLLNNLENNFSVELLNVFINDLTNTYFNAAESCSMVKQVAIHRKKRVSPWFDRNCKRAKNELCILKRNFKRHSIDINKRVYLQASKNYRKLIRISKRNYCHGKISLLRNAKNNDSKSYWKIINENGNIPDYGSLTPSDFRSFFCNLDNSSDNETFDLNNILYYENDILDALFTFDEIFNEIKRLINGKSSGGDNMINELLKASPSNLIHLLVKLFNIILLNGVLPDNWCSAIVVPIFKNNGSNNDCSNYRGISLLNVLGKLFTSLMNNRLTNFLNVTNTLGKEQVGFRKGFSVNDHCFVLNSLIDFYLSKKKRIYCAFVDYKKAFDSVNHVFLWRKLLSYNINGKFFKCIFYLYNNAISQVKVNNTLSDYYNCKTGVRQGDNLSPLLFALFINDFLDNISSNYRGLNLFSEFVRSELNDEDFYMFINIYILLYADDTLILADSEIELNCALDALHNYCNTWKIDVNFGKTKVVIFSRGRVRNHIQFKIGNNNIEVVDSYIYLGIEFCYNGKFHKAMNNQIDSARKASFKLLCNVKRLLLPIDIHLDLFDKLVNSILLYGSEIWAYQDTEKIEVFHRKFCRNLLSVGNFTSNDMLYGELGVTGRYVIMQIKVLSLWAKLVNNSHSYSGIMYHILWLLFEKKSFESKWLAYVKQTLDFIGLSYLWYSNCINVEWFKNIVKLKLNDIFWQNWNERIQNSAFPIYKLLNFSLPHKIQDYLLNVNYINYIYLIKLRCRNIKFPSNLNYFSPVYYSDRTCNLCANSHGDEFHYLLECSYFVQARHSLIPQYFYSNINTLKFSQLLSCTNSLTLKNLNQMCKILHTHFNA